MAATLVAKTSKYNGDGNAGFTTDAINTTGANLLIIVCCSYNASTVTPTDSKSNTWQGLTMYGSGTNRVKVWYAYSPTVGTGHTFSLPTSSDSSWATYFVLAYSGMVTGSGVYDTINGSSTSNVSGNITPAASGELILSGYTTTNTDTYVADGDFSEEFQQPWENGVQIGGAVATVNPYNSTNAIGCTWTATGASEATVIVAFKISAGTAYTLDASAGSFSKTGIATSLLFHRSLGAAAGSFAQAGIAASLLHSYTIAADAGAYALTGLDASFPRIYLLASEAGAHVIAGLDAALLFDRLIGAESGAYILSGVDAALLLGRSLAADAGTYALTGLDIALWRALVLLAAQGAYTLIGVGVELTYTPAGGYTLVASSGAFAIAGLDAALLAARILAGDAGAYAQSGSDAALLFNRLLEANAEAYALDGVEAEFDRAYQIAGGAGAYVLAGNDLAINYSGERSIGGGLGGYPARGDRPISSLRDRPVPSLRDRPIARERKRGP